MIRDWRTGQYLGGYWYKAERWVSYTSTAGESGYWLVEWIWVPYR